MATNKKLENIEQALIECIADFLDTDQMYLNQVCAEVRDPESREQTEIHVRMAKAAFDEYRKTVIDV